MHNREKLAVLFSAGLTLFSNKKKYLCLIFKSIQLYVCQKYHSKRLNFDDVEYESLGKSLESCLAVMPIAPFRKFNALSKKTNYITTYSFAKIKLKAPSRKCLKLQ